MHSGMPSSFTCNDLLTTADDDGGRLRRTTAADVIYDDLCKNRVIIFRELAKQHLKKLQNSFHIQYNPYYSLV